MNKKIFGIKIGTYLTVIFCAVAAVLFWLYVKYMDAASPSCDVTAFLRGFLWR